VGGTQYRGLQVTSLSADCAARAAARLAC